MAKKKYIIPENLFASGGSKGADIRKVGPMSWRQLQQANYTDPEVKQLDEQTTRNISYAGSAYDTVPEVVQSSAFGSGNEFGESMWDNNTLTEYELGHIDDIRAENQWGIAQLGAGIAKGAGLAATTFLSGTLGLGLGIAEAIGEGKVSKLWDNEITNALNDFNERMEEWLPNYYSEAEQNRAWWENLGTANFWGDKLIKNLGFTVGAYYSGGIFSKGLLGIAKLANAGSKVTNLLTRVVGGGISAINEGSIEGLNAAKDYKREMAGLIDEGYQQDLIKAQREYAITGDMSAYEAAYNTAQAKRLDAIQKLDEDAAKVGNVTLALNLPILMASNIYQFGRLYSGGTKWGMRSVKNNIQKTVEGGYEAVKKSAAKKVGTILGGGLSEGAEEMSQSIASSTAHNYYAKDFNNYYRALNDLGGQKEALSWIKSFGETLSQKMSDTGANGAWEEFAIGAMTGLLGMPRFRSFKSKEGKAQSPIVLEENIFSKWKELSKVDARTKSVVDYLNNRVKDPKFQSYYQGLARHLKYDKDKQDAATRGDSFDYKNAEHAQLISDIEMFGAAGRTAELKALIGESFDASDENIEKLLESTKDDPNNPFIDEKGNTKSKQRIKDLIEEQQKRINTLIDTYAKKREKLDLATKGTLSDEMLNERTWMELQIDDWNKRGTEMMGDIKGVARKLLGMLNVDRADLENTLREEGKKGNGTPTDAYKKADKDLQGLKITIENIEYLLSLNDEDAVNILTGKKAEGFLQVVQNMLQDPNYNSNIEPETQADILDKIKDIQRLAKAKDLYSKKLIDYYFHPEQQEKDHAKVDTENIEAQEAQDMATKLEEVNKQATFGELSSLMNSGDYTQEDFEKGSTQTAKDYRKASLWRMKALEAAEEDADHAAELKDMIERRFRDAKNYDELADDRLITDMPESMLVEDEKDQEALQHTFKEILKKTNDKIASGESQKKGPAITFSDNAPEEGETGKDGVPTVTDKDSSKKFSLRDACRELYNGVQYRRIEDEKEGKEWSEDYVKRIFEAIDTLLDLAKKEAVENDPEKKASYLQEMGNVLLDIENTFRGLNGGVEHSTGGNVDLQITLVEEEINKERLTLQNPIDNSTKEEVQQETDQDDTSEDQTSKNSAVSGAIKTVVPQFDLDAKKDGKLIAFVGEGRNAGYTYVYTQLSAVDPKTGKNAFDYVNEGNVKEGDALEVRYEPATDEHPELLALYHNGVLVNYMNVNENIAGVKEIKEKAIAAYNANKTTPTTTTQPSTTILTFNGVTGTEQATVEKNKIQLSDLKVGDKIISFVSSYSQGIVTVEKVEGDSITVSYKDASSPLSSKALKYFEEKGGIYRVADTNTSTPTPVSTPISTEPNPTVIVTKVMNGSYGHSRTNTQPLGSLLGTDDAKIGVKAQQQLKSNTTEKTERIFGYSSPEGEGRVYVLLPNSKGTLSPKRIYIKHFNPEEFDLKTEAGPIATKIKEAILALTKINSASDKAKVVDDFYMALHPLLYLGDSFHIHLDTRDKDGSQYLSISYKNDYNIRQSVYINLNTKEGEPISAEQIGNHVLQALYKANLPFNINAKRLQSKEGQAYANELRDSNVLITYLTGKRMQGTWFILNGEKPTPETRQASYEKHKAEKVEGTKVTYAGKEYAVKNGVIYDKNGNQVTLSKAQTLKVKDLAAIQEKYGDSLYGVNQHDGVVYIKDENGERGLNRKTGKYLSDQQLAKLKETLKNRNKEARDANKAVQQLKQDQKQIVIDSTGRPDTSENSQGVSVYHIKEEDQQVHEYDRVHSAIGNNYIGPTSKKKATSFGQVVDDFNREYLESENPNALKRPKELSEQAFNGLKKGLRNFKEYARKHNLTIVTDRIVVFHKFPDGRRIAGELDCFAYNPTTGEVIVFDFKTSSYSTKDKSFSTVTRPDLFTRSNKDQYTLQLSAYSKILQAKYGFNVKGLVLIPFHLTYSQDGQGISNIVAEDLIPLTYNAGVLDVQQQGEGSKPAPKGTIKGQLFVQSTNSYVQIDLKPVPYNGVTYYTTEYQGHFLLMLPNGVAVPITSADVKPASPLSAIGQEAESLTRRATEAGYLNGTPLANSPYGSSLLIGNAPTAEQKDNAAKVEKVVQNDPPPTPPSVDMEGLNPIEKGLNEKYAKELAELNSSIKLDTEVDAITSSWGIPVGYGVVKTNKGIYQIVRKEPDIYTKDTLNKSLRRFKVGETINIFQEASLANVPAEITKVDRQGYVVEAVDKTTGELLVIDGEIQSGDNPVYQGQQPNPASSLPAWKQTWEQLSEDNRKMLESFGISMKNWANAPEEEKQLLFEC